MKEWLIGCIGMIWLGACSSSPKPPVAAGQIDRLPEIYPDYTGVTVPVSIAPLNFAVQTEGKACAVCRICFRRFILDSGQRLEEIVERSGRERDCSYGVGGRDGNMEVFSSVLYERFNGFDRPLYCLSVDCSGLSALGRNGDLSAGIGLFSGRTDFGEPADGW